MIWPLCSTEQYFSVCCCSGLSFFIFLPWALEKCIMYSCNSYGIVLWVLSNELTSDSASAKLLTRHATKKNHIHEISVYKLKELSIYTFLVENVNWSAMAMKSTTLAGGGAFYFVGFKFQKAVCLFHISLCSVFQHRHSFSSLVFDCAWLKEVIGCMRGGKDRNWAGPSPGGYKQAAACNEVVVKIYYCLTYALKKIKMCS
jgi:hypothetical protein